MKEKSLGRKRLIDRLKDNITVEPSFGFICYANFGDIRLWLGTFSAVDELLVFASSFVHRNDGATIDVHKEIKICYRDSDGVKHTIYREMTKLGTLSTECECIDFDLPF